MISLAAPALQAQPADPSAGLWTFGTAILVAVTFLGTLLVGGLLLALAPDYLDGVVAVAEDRPGPALLVGVGVFVALGVVTALVAAVPIGAVLALVLLLVTVACYLVGSAVAFVAVGARLLAAVGVGGDSRWGALVAGAVVAAILAALPLVGGLGNVAVNAAGLGAVVYRWRRGGGTDRSGA